MELYYIRHGQSINNLHWKKPGFKEHPDAPLTQDGQEQARLLAEHIRSRDALGKGPSSGDQNRDGYRFTHLYTSLVERAVATSAHVAGVCDAPWTAWVDIHETGGIFGRDETAKLKNLPGHPRSFFAANFPSLILPESLGEDGWWNKPFETEEQCEHRARKFLAELLDIHGDKEGREPHRVAIVSHGGFFMHLMCAMLNLPWRQAAHGYESWFYLNNCSISRFDLDGGELHVKYLNKTEHLGDSLITS